MSVTIATSTPVSNGRAPQRQSAWKLTFSTVSVCSISTAVDQQEDAYRQCKSVELMNSIANSKPAFKQQNAGHVAEPGLNTARLFISSTRDALISVCL